MLYSYSHSTFMKRCRLGLIVSALVAVTYARKLENGLDIRVTNEVECEEKTKIGDIVEMHYTGKLDDGKVFDSSVTRDEPFEFELGAGMVIAGWDQGLKDMCIGEKRTLIIPPKLGYGSRNMGSIPPNSRLTFDTELLSINGKSEARPPLSHTTTTTLDNGDPEPMTQKDKAIQAHSNHTTTEPDTDMIDASQEEELQEKEPGAENGECRLLGPFALMIQAGLGVLALLSLVWKRQRERPRRPVKVWLFDVSKQVFGSVLLHLLNLVMSEIPASKGYDIQAQAKNIKDETGRRPNPCSFYLINIAVDTTIGVPILFLLLKILQKGASLTALARPAESIKSGVYGHPPQATWWLKQSIIYFLALLLMKLCVFFIFAVLPWIALVGDWALRWTEDSENLQIAFTMFVFPLIMNAIQYYIIDSFIKDRSIDEHDGDTDDDDDDEVDEREPLHRGDVDDESQGGSRRVSTEQKRRTATGSSTPTDRSGSISKSTKAK